MMFEAVLFDCDGVLVDSEAITCGVLRDMFEEQGWRMSLAECMQRFVGHTVKSQRSLIEANTGVPLTDDWLQHFFSDATSACSAASRPSTAYTPPWPMHTNAAKGASRWLLGPIGSRLR
jgi:beta-phosphoglucomutase-like phosphatase (HAD superfamily)